MIFYLGTHEPFWLRNLDVPLFVSRTRLARLTKRRRSWPRARTRWAMDSGGFTEIARHGQWTVSPQDYLAEVRRAVVDAGNLDWAAPQDWMCEPPILAKTGKTVAQHQRLTVDNLLLLRSSAPDLPIVPVLQGWTADDYRRCCDLYAQAGVDLTREPVVGLGSVCRRQGTADAVSIVRAVLGWGPIKLHGFGFKTDGAAIAAQSLASSDSLAWSRDARWSDPMPGCTHDNCSNCLRWALRWRERLIARFDAASPPPATQGDLF